MEDKSASTRQAMTIETVKGVMASILRTIRRCFAVILFTLVIWVVTGSIWFPEWWYRFFWNGGLMDSEYWQYGWAYLLNEETVLLIILCTIGIASVVFIRFFSRPLQPKLYRWATLVIAICAFALLTTALVLYKTQSDRVEAENDSDRISAVLEAAEADKGWTPPAVEAPVDFRYLDMDRVLALYSEVESEFPEKERTVSSERSGDIDVGVGNSKAELSGKGTETASFQRQNLSPERKCIDVLNILLPKMEGCLLYDGRRMART
jgi:hypothetical protein